MADGTPAGWYDDPSGEGKLRHWNGSNWTEHYHEKPTAPTSPERSNSVSGTSSPVPVDGGEWDPDVVWAATGKPLTGIGAGRYKLTKFYLFSKREL